MVLRENTFDLLVALGEFLLAAVGEREDLLNRLGLVDDSRGHEENGSYSGIETSALEVSRVGDLLV